MKSSVQHYDLYLLCFSLFICLMLKMFCLSEKCNTDKTPEIIIVRNFTKIGDLNHLGFCHLGHKTVKRKNLFYNQTKDFLVCSTGIHKRVLYF